MTQQNRPNHSGGVINSVNGAKLAFFIVLVLILISALIANAQLKSNYLYFSNSMLPKLLGTFDFNISSRPAFCQSTNDKFLQFRDRGNYGSGLNHKFSEFRHAAAMAVKLNRILVDYPMNLQQGHNKDVTGHQRSKSRNFHQNFKYYYSHLIDIANLQFDISSNVSF